MRMPESTTIISTRLLLTCASVRSPIPTESSIEESAESLPACEVSHDAVLA